MSITAISRRPPRLPGVAQRTGATIYYVELFPAAAAKAAGAAPVLALMPLPGDVDVVLASELMEAGRALQRGLVTADRTTLVASTHRVYAIAEKTAMGDGRADAGALLQQVQAAARRFIGFDMAAAAERSGSVISSVLFGALAATGELPFTRAQFEGTIQRGGVGVKSSLAAFDAAFQQATAGRHAGTRGARLHDAACQPPGGAGAAGPRRERATRCRAAAGRLKACAVWSTTRTRLMPRCTWNAWRPVGSANPADATLRVDLARHLALWMSYEDTIRVADLKTRDTRFARVKSEVRAADDQLLAFGEFMHPRLQEIADTLPAALGRWLLASGAPRRLVERLGAKGRVVRTSSLGGFGLLWIVAGPAALAPRHAALPA